jgi:hypothetical protein
MKSWKKWPYWLKGGVIAGGITLVSIFLAYGCDLLDTSTESFFCLPTLVISPMFPFVWLIDINPQLSKLPGIFLPIISVIGWFLIGSLIGELVKRTKSEKKNRSV